jgi:hypothetical protein
MGAAGGAGIVVNVEGFRYPLIARSARIQGDVTFEVSATDVKLVDGNPILAAAAQTNLGTWILPPAGGTYMVSYHFSLSGEPGIKPLTVLIGNRFDRFFLRLFRALTERVVEVCDNASDTRVQQAVTREGGDYAIDVFVADKSPCVNISYSHL